MSVFDRPHLDPASARSVARQRLRDAVYLLDSTRDEHANAAMYLAGFYVELMLKAKMLEQHPWLMSSQPPRPLSKPNRRLYRLVWYEHELEALLTELPGIHAAILGTGHRNSGALSKSLGRICAEWTIYARYTPERATIQEAADFLSRIQELTPWLN